MEPIGWHVVLRCTDNRVIAPSVAERHQYVESTLQIGKKYGLFAYGLPHDHAHHGLICSRPRAGGFARDLSLSLTRLLPNTPKFEPARIRPINDAHHAATLINYMIGQSAHHDVWLDPLHEATSAFDMLGLRPMGSHVTDMVALALPKFRCQRVLDHLPAVPFEASDLAHVRAAMFSVAVGVRVEGTRIDRVMHAAAAQALDGASVSQIAAALGVCKRTIRRALSRDVDPTLVRAIRLQMGFRQAVVPKLSACYTGIEGVPEVGELMVRERPQLGYRAFAA